MYYGLTSLGVIHTIISLVAVVAGIIALFRDRQITPANGLGRTYVITTVIVCVTGFGIFQHGGFGKPHALGVLTLLVLAFAWATAQWHWFGRASRYVQAVSYSATFLFHLIPAITETTTRLPLGKPLLATADAPELQAATGALVVLFIIGAILQIRSMRAASRSLNTDVSMVKLA